MDKEKPELAIVERLRKDAIQERKRLQEMAQNLLEANRPAFAAIAQHAETLERIRADIEDSPFMRQIRDFAEAQAASSEQEIILSPKLSATRQQDECDYIVDAVVAKLSEESNQPQGEVVVVLPSNARWESVAIDMRGDGELVVKYRDAPVDVYGREALGFSKMNTASKSEDVCWELLRGLALLKQEGLPATKEQLHQWLEISDNAVEKRVSRLARKLQDAFGLLERPFWPYDPKEGYQTKFALRPEALLRGDGEVHRSGMSFDDELYKEEGEEE